MKQHDEQHRLRTCLWIVNTFQRRGKLTLRELNELWKETDLSGGEEIQARTFYNYRSAIQDLLNIVLECDKRTNKYQIAYSDETTTTDWLLSSFSVGQLLQQNKDLSSRILLEEIPSGQQHLSTIIDGMRQKNVIEIKYCRFVEDEPHAVQIEPYCTKLFHQRWYVLGRNIERNHLQTYALDRISDIKILSETYEIDKDFDAKGYFHNSFGIFSSESELPVEVKIKADSTQSKYLRTLPLHHSQKEIISNNQYSVFRLFLVPTKDFIFELLSHGALYEVLEPESLRKEMKSHAEKLSALYKY